MTENPTLPLTLDDVRVASPDRDNAEVFDPGATWGQACGYVAGGYAAAEVAALLMELDDGDLKVLREWSNYYATTADGTGLISASDADLPLLAALNKLDTLKWELPPIEPESALAILRERDRAVALLGRVATLLRHATDAGLLDQLAAHMHPDEINGICDAVAQSIAEGTAQ